MKPASTSALVSVVMLSYNRREDVAEGIGQLLSQEYENLEIIVVDNGSSDNTARMVLENFPQVTMIALEQNLGVAAYNIGFDRAGGDYIVVLDDDSFPERYAIPRMVKEFEADPQLGVVAFDVRNHEEFVRAGAPGGDPKNNPHRTNTSCRYQLAFNGCGVGIRKQVLRQVGGYPEEFFLYWNEQDLAIRILDAGYHIRWFTDIISYHKYAPSNRSSLRAPFYYTRNLYWLTWKYFPPVRLLKDTLRLFYLSFYYTFEQRSPVYLKATFSALYNLRRIKRRPAGKEIIRRLRLTHKLAFIYFR